MHYIKHLVYITGRRNSFFVALGLSRLLHNYSTAETAQIHELVAQDPNRGRDDSYYRRRKAQLMRELQERFGDLLAVQRGARGEERFQALLDAQGYLAWVKECLGEFTPWGTYCCLPKSFDPHTDELQSLSFRGDDPDGEHEVEIRRLHALLHPDCFESLIAALRLDAPDKRLEVPEFQLRDDKPHEPPGGGQPPTAQLSEENMQSLKESIIQEREQRRRFSPAWLRIVVDGAERARWLLNQSRSGQIEIGADDRMIEIYGLRDGENVRLAAHMLSYDLYDRLRPLAAKLRLEGGQELGLSVEPLRVAGENATDEDDAGATVAVSYRETAPLRALLWRFSQLRHRLFDSEQRPVWKPALAFMLLALSVATIGYAFWNRRSASSDDVALNVTPTPQVSPTTEVITSIPSQPVPTAEPNIITPSPKPAPGGESTEKSGRPVASKSGYQSTGDEPVKGPELRSAKKETLASGAAAPPTVSPAPGPPVEAPAASRAAPAPEPPVTAPRRSSRDDVIATDIRARSEETRDAVTRGENALAPGLIEAKKVYLYISGAHSEQARQQLQQRLPIDNKFSLTDNQDEADIAIKVTVSATRQGRIALTAFVLDASLKIIWPLTPGVTARKYEGPLEKVVETFSRDLAGDIQRLERQK
jgi:hypothetical protein